MSKLPIVAIVGRANVGKSSLFNRLVNERQAIVAQEAGTTRDAVYGHVQTDQGSFALVDTAGLKRAEDDFEQTIQDQIIEAAVAADVILVVVDATTMPTDEDRQVAKLARKSGRPTLLVVNKSEGKVFASAADFARLGLDDTILTSASQGRGINELIEVVLQKIRPVKATDVDPIKIALIGRPNVGKSSLFNALGEKQQAVVSSTAGTTRDVNRLSIIFRQRRIELLDTAGIRKPGKVERGIEKFSVMRAISAIEEADICLLVIDVTEPGVTLEQKLAGIVKDAGKGLILVLTKWDLIDKDAYTHDELMAKLKKEFLHVPWALFSVSSAKTGQNLTRLFQLALNITEQRERKLKTTELNKWLIDQVNHHPPAGPKNAHPKLRYITQTGNNPPEFTIFGTHTGVLHWSYHRYLERQLREQFGFDGTAIRLIFRDKQ